MNNITTSSDEISLYEIWQILVKHKKIFWISFLIITIIGSVIAVFKPAQYQYNQLISVAAYSDDSGKNTPAISPGILIQKFSKVYLPNSIKEYNNKHTDTPIRISENAFTVEEPQNAGANNNVLILSIKGPLKNKLIYSELFNSLLAQLQSDAALSIQPRKDYLDKSLINVEQQLEIQIAARKTLEQKLVGIEKTSSNEFPAKALMLSELNSKIYIINSLRNDIQKFKFYIASLQDTKFSSNMVISNEPIGPSKLVLIVLSLIVGIIIGFFVVFIVEFFSKMKEQKPAVK